MINLRIAVFSALKLSSEDLAFADRVFEVLNPKDLIRLLIQNEVDLIVAPAPTQKESGAKFKKIFKAYQVPFLFIGKVKAEESSANFCYSEATTSANLKSPVFSMKSEIESHRIARKYQKMSFILMKTTQYTNSVLHATKDLFITETKNYFKKNFKLESCQWVHVHAISSKLPPILKIKQELERQKVDQGSMISSLDSCSVEVVNTDNYQIWKTTANEYMAFVWILGEGDQSQCIILKNIQIKKLFVFEDFLAALSPFLKRRWSLCLTMAEAQEQVYRDSLTSLHNQKFLFEVLDKKIEEYKRYKTPFSILFIDVDHFKRVNDSLGHVVGSGVLCDMGDLLLKQIRNTDYAFRYGGDEFIILLSHTEGEDAHMVAERIRKKVESYRFYVSGEEVEITVSIGLAFFPEHAQSAEDIVRIADEAMYYGKNKSRNVVYQAS
jgi:diguanylate cyclase (GGDEF)-like protein